MKANSFFRIETYEQPLAGKGLVLGTDDDGNSVEPKISLSEVADQVTFPSLTQLRSAA